MRRPFVLTRAQKLYVVCAAVFLTALVLAEATASKFFTAFTLPFTINILGVEFREVVMTAGVLAFPITFIATDLINEYYGKPGIRFVTLVGMAMVVFEFVLLQAVIGVPVASISPVSQEAVQQVFGASGRVILGSLTAYAIGQFVDIALFHWLRGLTGGKHLWLRATGSTFGSQFFDTLIVLTVAFAGQLGMAQILAITLFNYTYKLLIAVGITPLIYAAHAVMDRYLGDEAEAMIHEAALVSGSGTAADRAALEA